MTPADRRGPPGSGIFLLAIGAVSGFIVGLFFGGYFPTAAVAIGCLIAGGFFMLMLMRE